MFKKLLDTIFYNPTVLDYPDEEHRQELREIYDNLHQDLKQFANQKRQLGLGHNLNVRFNERGIAELVKQLDEAGFEIRRKDS